MVFGKLPYAYPNPMNPNDRDLADAIKTKPVNL
jgi:hypothetical protein